MAERLREIADQPAGGNVIFFREKAEGLALGLALIGVAVPYAIAAKFAHPDRPVIALVGDGAMQMNNMAKLITVAKYWRGRC